MLLGCIAGRYGPRQHTDTARNACGERMRNRRDDDGAQEPERHAAGSIETLRLRRTITIIADIRIVMMSEQVTEQVTRGERAAGHQMP